LIVSDTHQFVYVAPPKTASTSLHNLFEKDEWSGDYVWRTGEQHRTMMPKRVADYLTWAVVRNPYRRLASLWVMSQRETQRKYKGTPQLDTFQDFLEWNKQKTHEFYSLSQWDWFNTPMGGKDDDVLVGRPDIILKFEDLPGCLELLPFVYRPLDVENLNKTYSDLITLSEGDVKAAADFVEDDCREFGYEFLGR
jgi:hypothetical protein